MNKMFKKLMAVSATVAIAATMSVSAFAAGETATHTDGSVSVTGYAAVDGATQYTVMLFLDSEDGIDVNEIYYINQSSDPAALLTGMLVKATDGENALPDGDYTVRIGNDTGSVVDVDLVIEDDSFVLGDVNGDGAISSMDASLILQKAANIIASFPAPTEAADVNGDGSISSMDASLVLQKAAGIIDSFPAN